LRTTCVGAVGARIAVRAAERLWTWDDGVMLVAFSVAPSGTGDSVSEAVADAVAVVRDSGLPNTTDAMFTTIEGEWEECMDVVRRACEAVGKHGNRVSLVLKADIRPGYTNELTGKVERMEAAMANRQPGETPRD